MNKSEKRRQSKKNARRVALNQSTHKEAIANTYAKNFPNFCDITPYTAHEMIIPDHFKQAVNGILSKLRLNDRNLFTDEQIKFFTSIRRLGFNAVIKDNIMDHHNSEIGALQKRIGDIVFERLNNQLDMVTPYCDVSIMLQRDVCYKLDALREDKTKGGIVYYSRKFPTVTSDGIKLIVGFSRHAIDQLCKRVVHDMMSYYGAGDAFAYVSNCIYYELLDVYPNGLKRPVIAIYNICLKGAFEGLYVRQVLGQEHFQGRKFYHRLGYCPVDITDNGYAKAITFLTPGMRGTPEFELISTSDISTSQKRQLNRLVAESGTTKGELIANQNFTALKWFHEHGIPQVVEFEHSVFDYS